MGDAGVQRTYCSLTFPRETNHYPLSIDLLFLHAIGVKYFKGVGRRVLGRDRAFGAICQRENGEFISLCTDTALRNEIKRAQGVNPDYTMYLHLIYTPVSRSSSSHPSMMEICAGNPNFSPEPAAMTPSLEKSSIEPTSSDQTFRETKVFQSLKIPAPPNNQQEKELEGASEHIGRGVVAKEKKKQPNEERPRFYISDSWHLQAEKMSMSMSSSFVAQLNPTKTQSSSTSSSGFCPRTIPEQVFGNFSRTSSSSNEQDERRPHQSQALPQVDEFVFVQGHGRNSIQNTGSLFKKR